MLGIDRDRLLACWSRWVSRHPVVILLVALALAALAAWIAIAGVRLGPLAAGPLVFQSDRNALIDETIPWNRRFIAWWESFPGAESMVVVVDAGPAGARRAGAERFVEALAARLERADWIEQVTWRLEFGPRAARLASRSRLAAVLEEAEASAPLLMSPTPAAFLEGVSRRFQAQAAGAAHAPEALGGSIARLAELIEAMRRVLAAPPASPALSPAPSPVQEPGAADPAPLLEAVGAGPQVRLLRSENGRLYFLRLIPRPDAEALEALGPAIEAVRREIDRLLEAHPGIEAGLTGIEVIEADETAAAERDSLFASVLALLLIAGLLLLANQSWRTPLLILAALLVGIAWSFGFAAVAVGHLQVLSVIFAVMLLGLGVAYGIHFAAGYEQVRHAHPPGTVGFRAAIDWTLRRTGPGVVTGALTTAAAFSTTLATDFTGVAEMGLVAAGGILLCLVAMVGLFPALLRLAKRDPAQVAHHEHRWVHLFETRWITPFVRHPRRTLGVAALAMGLSALLLTQMRFDHDLLKLQPRGAPSVRWAERIAEEDERSIFYGISVAEDLETARARTEALRELETVEGVGGIGRLFPREAEAKRAMLAETRKSLEAALASAKAAEPVTGGAERLPAQVEAMGTMLAGARGAGWIPAPLRPEIDRLAGAMEGLQETVRDLPEAERNRRLERLARAWAAMRRSLAGKLTRLTDPAPLRPADLPPALVRPSIADRGPLAGHYALEIYPRLPEGADLTGPLDPRFLPRFVSEMRSVDPEVTGVIMQIYRSGALILASYTLAGMLALGVVLVLVWIDFRSLHDALLALLPVVAGFSVTFGIMVVAGMPVNPANIIVLPLMFGIGGDDGVHMIHRYRQEPDASPPGLTSGTGKGITVTTLTSMVAFGALLTADHRGMASIGFVLFVGLGMTLLACWTLLPAWLTLRQARGGSGKTGA